MSALADRHAAIYAYRIALAPPLPLAGGRLSERRGLVLRLQQGERAGYGEAAPLPGFSRETLHCCEAALRQWAQAWLTGDIPTAVVEDSPSARFAFDCARRELAEGPLLGDPGLDAYPLLSGPADQWLARWQAWPAPRPRCVKLKLGREGSAEQTRLLQQLLALTPELRLRLDANRAWTLDEAQAFVGRLSPAVRQAIDYLEEPCQQLQQSLQLAERYAIPLALDESLREPRFRLPTSPALAALVLKPGISGGLAWLQQRLAEGRRRGLRCVLSSSFESSLGLGQLAVLARQLTPNEAPGLDTLSRFSHDLIRATPGSARPLLTLDNLPCRWQP